MRSSCMLFLGFLILLGCQAALAAEQQPASATSSAAQIPVNLPPALAAIRDANDPSAAVNAYAKAVGSGEDQIGAERVYLVRMTDFGLPEMADAQAQDLILRDPSNGLAWGVAAHMSARRGNMAAALGQVETATNFAPNDPFVLRTAGNVFAWYDARGAGVDIPDVIKTPVAQIKQRLNQNPTFAQAYSHALDEYSKPQNAQQQQPPQETTQQAPPQPAPAVVETYTQPSYPVYDTAAYYPTYYSGGYYSAPSYCYPSYCNGWPWWGGIGASFVFVSGSSNNCNNNNWHGHGNGHNDGHWNGNGNWNGNGGNNNWHGGDGNGNGRGGNNSQGQIVNGSDARSGGAVAGSSGSRSMRGTDASGFFSASKTSPSMGPNKPASGSGQSRPTGGGRPTGPTGSSGMVLRSSGSSGGAAPAPAPVAPSRAASSAGGRPSGGGSSMSSSRGGGSGGSSARGGGSGGASRGGGGGGGSRGGGGGGGRR